MFSSYKVFPMTADGDIYALFDPKGDQVAMGTREVCQALLYLVTNSPLFEKTPRRYGQVAPRERVRPASPPADGGAELKAVGQAGVKSIDVPRASGATEGIEVSAAVRRPEGCRPSGRSVGAEDAQEDAPALPSPASRAYSSRLGAGPFEAASAFGSPYASSYWYVSLYVVIVIVSALLTLTLLLSL